MTLTILLLTLFDLVLILCALIHVGLIVSRRVPNWYLGLIIVTSVLILMMVLHQSGCILTLCNSSPECFTCK